ncbi:MAG: hypothetical protein AB7F86_11625 [Bdellovibrionales bacterium]
MKQSLFIILVALSFTACSKVGDSMKHQSQTTANDPVITDEPAAGEGHKVPGKGALSVPVGDAVVARIRNGLERSVDPGQGNFARTLAQVRSNLPKVTDPTKATGYDQIQLLAYGACSDLTTGNTPLMQTRYNVTKNGTIANNKTALIAAGVRMLDQYVAGLASQSTAAVEVKNSLDTLVTKLAATSGSTSTIAFMSVCIAANSAGAAMMGF